VSGVLTDIVFLHLRITQVTGFLLNHTVLAGPFSGDTSEELGPIGQRHNNYGALAEMYALLSAFVVLFLLALAARVCGPLWPIIIFLR